MSLLPIALGVASGRSIVSTYYSATRKNEVHREVASFAHLVIPTTKAYYKAYRALNAIPEVINSEYGSYWLQPGKIQLVCVGHLLLHGISALTSGPNGPRDTTGYGGGSRNYSKDHDSRLPVLISRIAPVVLVIAQLGSSWGDDEGNSNSHYLWCNGSCTQLSQCRYAIKCCLRNSFRFHSS